MAGTIRRFPGEYQFGAGQRREKSRRCAENRAPRGGARVYQHGGNYSRPQRAVKAAGAARNGNFRRDYDAGEALVFALQRIPAQRRARPRTQLALPLRLALSLYLRGRPGALVLAAAGISGHSADAVHTRNAPPRIFHGEILRGALHRFLRAASGNSGQLAGSANPQAEGHGAASGARAIGANRLGAQRQLETQENARAARNFTLP